MTNFRVYGGARNTVGSPWRGLLGVCFAVVLVTAGACTGNGAGPATSQPDEVTYLTSLGLTGREGFVFVAQAKGFFHDVNMVVTVKPGKAGEFNLQALRGGRVQFVAVDYAGQVIRAGTGRADDVRCIAVLQQKTVAALMALVSSGVTTPRDLPGKRVANPLGSTVESLFPAYGKLAGLDPAQISSVEWVHVAGPQLPAVLAAHSVDVIGQFVPGEPTVSAAAKGADVSVLPYGDYMSDLYGNVVVARVGTDPDLQRRFARALVKGLQYAVDHPDEAGQIVHAAAPNTTAEGAAAELRLLKPYVASSSATPEKVARSIALLQGIGLIPGASIEPDRVFDFTVVPSATPGAEG